MGVKSLWSLLTPVGRPVMLETAEGKTMAIDSSIWIYQFQATMRDKDGRALVNAHVLGFLRRICKLLFYGIKPVFVFDGGAPALKRSTISERKKKKAGAAASHIKIAEQLLAAQMRREALNHARVPQGATSKTPTKGKAPEGPVLLDENAVYLEDIDDSVPKTPSRPRAGKEKATAEATPPSSKKKNRFHDHDPYRLPDVDLEENIANATRSTTAPDPRLATEDELRAFIDEMRPEDFDVNSPAFRELPTEVQYEIIGDLRLKSRQTSYKRLQAMLSKAPTPLDFSRQQIKNLKQRNSLTQQLLMTTDNIGKAHLMIPVRIASERNKEYVLMKNEGESGGWILGIRDDGTMEKPIEIDQSDAEKDDEDDDDADSDMEMEEVNIPRPVAPDPDLRDYKRGLALAAIDQRTAGHSRQIQRRHKAKPLFDFDVDADEHLPVMQDEFHEDPELALAIQESLDQRNVLRTMGKVSAGPSSQARPLSAMEVDQTASPPTQPPLTPLPLSSSRYINTTSDDEDLYASPTRLETALAIANAGPAWRPHISPQASAFGRPTLLTATHQAHSHSGPWTEAPKSDSEDSDMEEILPVPEYSAPQLASIQKPSLSPTYMRSRPLTPSPTPHVDLTQIGSDSDDMEEVHPAQPVSSVISSDHSQASPIAKPQSPASLHQDASPVNLFLPLSKTPLDRREASIPLESPSRARDLPASRVLESSRSAKPQGQPDSDGEEIMTDWSRSPSPVVGLSKEVDAHRTASASGAWDAAEEMDFHAEEGEFARFVSQVKGRNIDDVRAEIDDEIKSLNQQRKVAMRDSEDITQQMISQIMLMLRLFGIPYITAPMEAEAQCAELVQLGLVEGIITDDSDVFLFGGLRVFKNMFNQSKTVECFLLSDLGRELGLDRDTLVRLAYLLGSDYVDGLPGVGPVVAMELLKEFPGEDGLHKFKDWWMKVQTGKDKADDTKSKFRKRFKKKFKDLYLPSEWPNPAVRDAYYHPTVDDSDEPFKWGLPDLDALRGFLREELGWHQTKVDDLLLPIIQKIGKRGQTAALNKQGNLDEFFDVSAGSGAYAPRKRQAYQSKRLQQVVSEYRNEKTKLRTGQPSTPTLSEESGGSGADTDKSERPTKKRKKAVAKGKGKGKARAQDEAPTSKKPSRRGRGKGRATVSVSGRKKLTTEVTVDSEDEGDEYLGDTGDVVGFVPHLRPRPKPKPAYKAKVDSESDHGGNEELSVNH